MVALRISVFVSVSDDVLSNMTICLKEGRIGWF